MNNLYPLFRIFERMQFKALSFLFVLVGLSFQSHAQLQLPLNGGTTYPIVATNSQEGKLYTISVVDTSHLNEIYEVCVYNGNFWACLPHFKYDQPVGSLGDPQYLLTSICEFKGDIYIGGKFINGNVLSEASNLYKFDGNAWVTVAKNINTKDYGINKMVVWNDTLVAVGKFSKAGTRDVSNIAKFNGDDWSFFGTSPTTEGANGEIKDLEIINDNVFIVGDFNKVGGDPTGSIARWRKGQGWGGIGDPFSKKITHHIEPFDGDLVAIGETVTGDTTIRIFKDGQWILPSVSQPKMTVVNGIAKPVIINNTLYIYGPFKNGTDTIDLILYKESSWFYTDLRLPKDVSFQIVGDYNVAFGNFNITSTHSPFNHVMGLKSNKILISGSIYGDENNNCTFDDGELKAVAQIVAKSTDFSGEFYLVETDDIGNWEMELNAGKGYTFKVLYIKDKYNTTCSKKSIVPQASGVKIENFNFGLDFSKAESDLKVTTGNLFGKISPNNKESVVYFYASNCGNVSIDGKSIHIAFDSSLAILEISPTPADQKPGMITWTVNNLKPGETFNYRILLNPITKSISTPLTFLARTGSGSILNDADTKDNFDTLRTTVQSFDELNYKTVSNEGTFESINQLDYGIYFTNTTNNIATSVTVIDTLDTDLPLTEMRLLNQSHKSTRTIKGNVYTVTYNDINLQSRENGSASTSGFFEYKFIMDQVVQKAADQTFTNTATIVFNYANSKRTNTVTSVLSKFTYIPPVENKLGLLLYPVPSLNQLKIENKTTTSMHLSVYSSTGQFVTQIDVNPEELTSLDVSLWSNGIYIISNGTSSTTFAVQH